MPLVSVVIPAYGHAAFVGAALDSVFAQTLADREVIVVNDGSPDDTAAVVRPHVDAGRVRYVEQPNRGVAAARNRGLALATGKYVALLDDDDAWPADKLAWQVDLLERDAALVLAWGDAVDLDTGAPLPTRGGAGAARAWNGVDVVLENLVRSPGQTLIRADALRAAGGFDETLWGVDDWDLYARLAQLGRFAHAPRVALRYRRHAANASHARGRMLGAKIALCEKHRALVEQRVRAELGRPRVDRFRDLAWLAWHAFETRRLGEARRLWARAALASPRAFARRPHWRLALAALVSDPLRARWRRLTGRPH